jgi:mono/diheme cytochrome c family protein
VRIAWRRSRRWVWAVGAFISLGVILAGVSYWLFVWSPGSSTSLGQLQPPVQALDPRQVARGQTIYQTYCAQCHGLKGEGQTNWRQQNPDDTYPPPPHDSTGHTWHHGDGLLYRIVRDGGTIYETPGFKSAMPAFGGQLDSEETKAVITYLKSLWGLKERSFQAEVSRQDPFP